MTALLEKAGRACYSLMRYLQPSISPAGFARAIIILVRKALMERAQARQGRAGVGGRGGLELSYPMGPKLKGWVVSANETVPLGDHIARFWVRSSRCATGFRNSS
jgi:hypothetical protein